MIIQRFFIFVSLWLAVLPAYAKPDGPPKQTVDVSQIPNATPQMEPLSRYGNAPQYTVLGQRYQVMLDANNYKERGLASWYGTKFHQQSTSSGEPYDMFAMTAAHKTLPLPSYIRVTHLANGRSIIVKVNDRGPFHDDRILDLSYVAAKKLGITEHGTGLVDIEVLDPSQFQVEATTTYAQLSSRVYLQVGAFRQPLNAERLANYLKQHSQLPVVLAIDVQTNQQPLYHVKIGPFTSNTLMQQATTQLQLLGVADAFPVILSQQL